MSGVKKRLAIIALGAALAPAAQAQSCLEPDQLLALDTRYETALQIGDVTLLDELLAPEFVWVHNLASMKENKAQLLARLGKGPGPMKQRRSHDISRHRLGNTAVLQGLSSVEKWNPGGESFRTLRYQFMRTYVEMNGVCRLLAVQTQKVWSSEGL